MESTVLTSGPDAGRVGWRPVGRGSPWLVNPIFHPEKLSNHHPMAGLNTRMGEVSDTDPPTPDAGRSGVEKILEHLLTA
ncbi:hypothetical protein [Gordonia sp. (in: high G+C Gram-positive bacteria)]|uniref:hypothetical protein n=1 Tax=Gordonia sp. (in: high G+C Gram-positive bacteria) TaxID=84139 RepID=UPI003BB739DD